MNAPLVIVGTGLAGYNVAREFRKLDRDTPLVLYTADDGCFYSKPMLSNALAKGMAVEQLATASAGQMAGQLDATIHTHAVVEALDPARRRLRVDGEEVSYASLVLAVGAEQIPLPAGGDAADAVLTVNSLGDYARFRRAIAGAADVAVIGPGLIGCEFANDLCQAGRRVTVIGPDAAPLGRLLPPRAGAALQAALAKAGVAWRLGVTATGIWRRDGAFVIELADGERLPADVVLSAIGLRPNLRLARSGGLRTHRGIVVDRHLQTSHPGIYAIGDCAEVAGLVLPFVMPIMHGARALARTLAGEPTEVRYPAMPVVVKTPAHPVVVSPPPAGAEGEWQEEEVDGGVRSLYRAPDGRLLGFALTGAAVSDKQRLTAELPPVLD